MYRKFTLYFDSFALELEAGSHQFYDEVKEERQK